MSFKGNLAFVERLWERYNWMGDQSVLMGDLGSSLAGQGDLSTGHNTISENDISSCGTMFMCCDHNTGMNETHALTPVTSSLQISSVQSLALSSQNAHNGQFGLNHNSYNNLETMPIQNTCPRGPYLNILIQPTNRIRYRYRSEKGSHGGLTGKTSNTSRKTYPTIRLENYRGNRQVCIKGTLYSNEDNSKLHVHKLMGRNCNEEGVCTIPVGEDMTAVFQNLGILFAGKKEVPQILFKRKLENYIYDIRNQLSLAELDKQRLREEAEKEAKSMNLNSVKICFEALEYNPETNMYESLCQPVFSDPIANQKSPDFGELKISRIDKCSGVCTGDEEVFLLCEKVNKKEIKVRFFELDNSGNITWESYGHFSETDVHHQVAIVFRTPPYRNTDIKNAVKVYLQLLRSKDGECSDPKEFHYKPVDHDRDGVEQKRKKPNYNPGFGGFGSPHNQYDPGTYTPGLPDIGNGGDNGMQGFFGQHSQGYQRQVMFKEESEELTTVDVSTEKLHDSNICNQANITTTDSESLNRDKPNTDQIKDFNTVKNCIIEKIRELYSYIDALMKEAIYKLSAVSKYMPNISAENTGCSLSCLRGNILRLINDYYSYVMNNFERLKIDTWTSIDSNLSQMLQQKRIQEEINDIKRKIAKEEAENIQYFAATGDVKELLTDKHHLLAVGNDVGDTPLHLILLHQSENVELLQSFLDVISDISNPINQINDFHQTCLHLAVKLNPKIIPKLLHCGADPNIQDRFGNTAIHLAVEANSNESLSHLLCINNYCNHENNFPRLSTLNYCGLTALHLAVIRGNEICIRLLCQSQCDINQQEGTRGRSVIHLAVEYNPPVLNLLLKREDIDLNLQDYAGNTALHLACSLKLKNTVLKLMKAGSNPNILNYDGNFTYDSEEEIYDSEEDNDNNDGKTALDLADGNEEITRILQAISLMETMDTLEESDEKSLNDEKKYNKLDDENIDKEQQIQPVFDSGYCSSDITLFDEKTISRICDVLDPPKTDWERLAMYLGIDDDDSLDKQTSPTRTIIKNFQRHGDVTMFVNALKAAQLTEVIDVIKSIHTYY